MVNHTKKTVNASVSPYTQQLLSESTGKMQGHPCYAAEYSMDTYLIIRFICMTLHSTSLSLAYFVSMGRVRLSL